MFPIGVSIWAVWFSFSVSAAAFMLSPFLALLDFLFHPEFLPAVWFAAIGLTGVGILLAIGMYYFGRALLKVTAAYVMWNINTVKGRK
jgi:uncharacterized membrane protein